MPELTNNIVESLLPAVDPEARVPQGVTADEVSARSESLTYIERRIFRWTTALQALIESERWDREIAGFQYATYGFVPISGVIQLPAGVNTIGGYVFGVAIELEAAGRFRSKRQNHSFRMESL